MADDNAALLSRLEALEIRAAYQDQTIEELNAALALQWAEIDRLKRELQRLEAEIEEASMPGDGLPEPPPPHY